MRTHPHSTLARLAADGTSYRDAATPYPSDSFPGMLAQVTGGDPRTTGVYHDDTWNAALLPAGTTDCAGAKPGAEVDYAEPADRDPSRVPDLIGIAQPGVVYTAKKSKIAEHGGDSPADRHVPIVVAGAGAGRGTVDAPVETTQIAPTILRLLGLDPRELDAVRIRHTAALPARY